MAEKTKRASNFTDDEIIRLVTEYIANRHVLEANFSPSITRQSKSKIWEKICDCVNSMGIAIRSVPQIKKKWIDTKSDALKKNDRNNRMTGGGKPERFTPGEQLIIEALTSKQSDLVTGIAHGYESCAKEPAYISSCTSTFNPNRSPLIASSFEDAIESLGGAQAANYPSTYQYGDDLSSLSQNSSLVIPNCNRGDVLIQKFIKGKESSNNDFMATCEEPAKKTIVTKRALDEAHIDYFKSGTKRNNLDIELIKLKKRKLEIEISRMSQD